MLQSVDIFAFRHLQLNLYFLLFHVRFTANNSVTVAADIIFSIVDKVAGDITQHSILLFIKLGTRKVLILLLHVYFIARVYKYAAFSLSLLSVI
jgi:hypothetical protein